VTRRIGPVLLVSVCVLLSRAQVTVIDTGSTNVPGMTVTFAKSGDQAMVERRDGSKQHVKLSKEMCDHMIQDLKAAGPLNELPVGHCMKSVSFGKSLFVEYDGVRSPDLSCSQRDERSKALKQDATDILEAAKKY
jgi:hypothetical protein